MPSIYAGDEQGFTGEKTDGPTGDDAVRPPFPDEPRGLAPFGADVRELHRQLISLRRNHPWLGGAVTTVTAVTNETIAIDLAGQGQRLTLGLNLSDFPVQLPGVGGPLRVDAHGWAIG